MSSKERALEIFKQYLPVIATSGQTVFRKTVINHYEREFGITHASGATLYNNAKKANPVEGLGRPAPPEGAVKASNKSTGPKVVDDSECFTVIELVSEGGCDTVGRCQSFLMQGDASEKFDEKVVAWPQCRWVMIKGLGPIHGEQYTLDETEGEIEIKRYTPGA
jgi:hypothetical protein